MKRDMDTVRQILFAVEDASAPVEQLDDCDDSVFSYHVAILIESGLVRGDVSDGPNLQPMAGAIFRLTWSGHDFLDAARNDSVWHKTTDTVRSKGLSLTFDLLKELLAATIRGQIGL